MITVSVVEDNEQFRHALEAIIKGQEDFALAGSYESAEKALAGLMGNLPDIVIADISLPGMRTDYEYGRQNAANTVYGLQHT